MIGITMKPVEGMKCRRGERLYAVMVGQEELCRVVAKDAAHAERKLMACFRHELPGHVIDFDLEAWEKSGAGKEKSE